jgi:Zn-dependent protease/predicted transcriptional regulator
MFNRRVKLFSLFGFEVRLDASWIILAILVAWSLSVGLFPVHFKGLSTETYWMMGIVGALGLFFSIIVHEMAHSLVARRYGMSMKGITLFIFGGMAEMGDEATSPKGEFMMAIVGPLSSFAIALVFYGIYASGKGGDWPTPVNGVIGYLAMINAILGAFNLVPAFPLDGGRVLRAVLWKTKRNIRWATKISSEIGAGFGIFLIVFGFLTILRGNFVGGMWWALIGMFLNGGAKASYQQLVNRKALEGEPLERFINKNPVTVDPDLSLQDLVDDYVYKHNFKMFPVVKGDTLKGCVTTKEIKGIPREQWASKRVEEIAVPCSDKNAISPHVDAIKALATMNQSSKSRLMVVEKNRLIGIVTLKDLLRFLSLKIELED